MSVILMYHRVAELRRDPYGLAVHPDRFRAHVEHLAHLRRTEPLMDAAERGGAGTVAITFDDGYADNATVAAPMLHAAGLPATWFITAGRLGERRFWWDRLADALLAPDAPCDSVDLEVAGREVWLDLRTAEARGTALRFLHRRLRPLPPDALERAVDRIIGVLGVGASSDDDRTMTVTQLCDLASLPGQSIGAHTRTHLQLRGQDDRMQRDEILGSVSDLATLLQQEIQTFAYPFGSPSAVGELAPRLAAEAGCRFAVSTDPGRVTRRSNPHLLPRLAVGNWTGEEFAARLRQALGNR